MMLFDEDVIFGAGTSSNLNWKRNVEHYYIAIVGTIETKFEFYPSKLFHSMFEQQAISNYYGQWKITCILFQN